MKNIVIFDFDNTMTSTDTFKIWVLSVIVSSPFKLFKCLLTLFRLAFYKKRHNVQDYKNQLIKCLLEGLDVVKLEKINATFKSISTRFLRSEIINKAITHSERGNSVYIVTASPQCAVSNLFVGYDFNIIGLQFEVNVDRLTGNILRNGCYGIYKVNEFLTHIQGAINVDYSIYLN